MKKMGMMLLAAVLVLAWSAPMVMAAEKGGKKEAAESKAQKAQGDETRQVTHDELAQILVNVLGLARFLPAAPTAQESFAILMQNRIVPEGGWQLGKVVTKADLARVIVQSLKKQDQVKDSADPKSWIDFLRELGLPIDSVGEATSYVKPLAEPVALNVVPARTDPLKKTGELNPVDETQYGVDMRALVRVLSKMEEEQGEFRPKPVTPD